MIAFESQNTVAMIFPAEKKLLSLFWGWRIDESALLACLLFLIPE
jgi:hypothetical protein